MAKCKVCNKPLIWKQNEATERWVPFDPNGNCHLITCKGVPPKGSKKQLEEKVDELEVALKKTADKVAGEKYWRDKDKEEHCRELAQYKSLEVYQLMPWQTVINIAKALGRAKLKKTGKINHHVERMKLAAIALVEADDKRKKGK